ncbi:TetR/AcrR family transcriptional regulator [Agromyces sp. NPDC049794]|uniref:TetR/AcrR family transcriptional regulator n=1 Tax=unclassified Agromyces TaxID=2639701 RepID=UPI0033F002B3
MVDSRSKRVPMAERREQLLDAAERVLVKDGVRGLTTRSVAAEAKCALATVHYVFDDVDDLLAGVLQRSVADVTQHLSEKEFQAVHTVEEAVAECLLALWELVEADPQRQIVQYELTLHFLRRDPSSGRQQYRDYASIVEGMLARLIAPELLEPGSIDSLARRITAYVDGLILQYLLDRDSGRARQDLIDPPVMTVRSERDTR